MAMKMKMPDTKALAADLPPTFWNKILTATPIVMTVIATALAALSTGEMSRAQYNRSLAAQLQSKAGDQWGFFQAKKLRGATLQSTLDLLRLTVPVGEFDPAAARAVLPGAADGVDLLATTNATFDLIRTGQLPLLIAAPPHDPAVAAALSAAAQGAPEGDVEQAALKIKPAVLAAEVQGARDRARAFDLALGPVNKTLDGLAQRFDLALAAASGSAALTQAARGFTAARLRFTARRYDAEASLNQAVAQLYELQVRQTNASADRHQMRSKKFFYGMLGAQIAVIVATFALAVQRRNVLWGFAAAAGVAAVVFGAYVYLFM